MLHLKVHLRFHFKKHKKLQKKCEEKSTSLNLKFGSLRVLYFLYKAEPTEFVDISN